MSIIASLAGQLLPGLFKIVDKSVKDKDEAEKLKRELQSQMLSGQMKEMQAAASIITAEAKSEHKLAAIWRPILMLVIVAIVANNYILAPYAEALFGVTGLALDLPARMWDLMVVGVGGYIGGRSGEKIVREWKKKSPSNNQGSNDFPNMTG